MSSMTSSPFRVVVAGGGIAGLEALLALRELGGDRISLTLVSPGDRFRLRPLSVAEPFALGHAQEISYERIAADLDVTHVAAAVEAVDDASGELRTDDRRTLEFDALLLTPGATMVASEQRALTWMPEGAKELFGGLLQDLDEGYVHRIAFVVPPGPTWPLPAYELALMTAREAETMGIEAEITVVTAEAAPLAMLGLEAPDALRGALAAAGVTLVTGTTVQVEQQPHLHLAPDGDGEVIAADRVVFMPALRGPEIEGVPRDDHGFILRSPHGLVEGARRTWAAGDGVASPLKLGGLATHQATGAAREIVRAAGVEPPEEDDELELDAVLMTGTAPVALDDKPLGDASAAPSWWPARKVASRYLEAYLERTRA
jgi:sulfide:quinone oxidoreductase